MVRKAGPETKVAPPAAPAAAPAAAPRATRKKAPVQQSAPAPEATAAPAPAPTATEAPKAGAARAAARSAAAAAARAQVQSPSFADAQRGPVEPPKQQRPEAAQADARDASLIDTVARGAGQAVRVARDAVSGAADAVTSDTAKSVADFANDHKGALAVGVAFVAAPTLVPTLIVTASVVGSVAAVARGIQHLNEGSSLPEAIKAVGTDVQGIKDTARESWTAFRGLFPGKK